MSAQKSNGPIIDPALCRCCRAIKKCRILTAEYSWMGKKEVYADMVMDCYGILLSHVDDNEKDSGVCATCVVRLREAIAFRHQVLQCEELFLQAKLDPPEEEKDINYESKLKKLELELKTEPKDYNSDHNSADDRDDACPAYSEDDEDNKPLKPEEKKHEEPLPTKNEEVKSEESDDYNDGSSSDSDEPIKKKAKRKTKGKANGAKKKPAKAAKKQKADTEGTNVEGPVDNEHTEVSPTEGPVEMEFDEPASIGEPVNTEHAEVRLREEKVNTELTESIFMEGPVKIEFTESEFIKPVTMQFIEARQASDAESIEDNQGYEEIPEYPEVPIEMPEIKKKRQWVLDRSAFISEYQKMFEELEANEDLYFEYLNMSKSSFEELHNMLESIIEKEDTNYRKSVSSKERLTICLRYYRTGTSYRTLSEKFRMGGSTVSNIVKEVSRALWAVLQPLYMPAPCEETWRQAEAGFRETWNFPNCVGSIGGKHIVSKHCSNQNTEYPRFSDSPRHKCIVTIALLAVADPLKKILALDIGNYAKQGDANVLENSKFFNKYMDKKEFLPAKPLPGDTRPTPHVLIGDSCFALRHNLLRPFSKGSKHDPVEQTKREFSKHLTRACTVDQTFDMLISSWEVLNRPMDCHAETAIAVLKAVCCLHNYVLEKHGDLYQNDSERISNRAKMGRKPLAGLRSFQLSNYRSTNMAMAVRNQFFDYFNRLGPMVDESESSNPGESMNESIDPVETDDPFERISEPRQSVDDNIIFGDPI